MEYNFREIEQKWQAYWKKSNTYKTEIVQNKPKFYVLDMFPYPSGAGLHVGHPLGYIASDIYSRYKRLQGFNVLHPMGYDAYGLPAEQYAIQTGQHPAVTTKINIARYREQLEKIGFCYDWDREIRTCEPDYYKWTQWAFIKMFNHYFDIKLQKAQPISLLVTKFETTGTEGIHASCTEELTFSAEEWNAKSEKEQQETLLNYRIAYLADLKVNWCTALGTVLANDEVSEGLSVRGGHSVEQRVMRQWSLRVSAYAQRLLDGLNTVDWTDSLKETQKNWIGRSEGAEMKFYLSPNPSPQERGKQPKGLFQKTTSDYNWKLLIDIAKDFRSNQTEAEQKLWQEVRAKKTGYKIRRQHIIDGYIADFINLEKKVIIEVDGGIHLTHQQRERDEIRTKILNEYGFHVIRFSNQEVFDNARNIAKKIKVYLDEVPSLRISPLSCGEGLGERSECDSLTVFTTRADTIYGVTFMVLAPESDLVKQLTTPEQAIEVENYVAATKKRTERERIADRRVTGVFSGSYAINPVSGTEIPIWISDYVLAGYGTGSIMAVPAHDSRDYAFAKHFNLPIIPLIEGCDVSEESLDAKEGTMMNSGFLNGLTVKEAIEAAKKYITEKGIGRIKVNFRLRDAIFSRQRYWGEPFPVYYKDDVPYMLDESRLPLELPEIDKFLPTEKGEPPLGRAKNWIYTPPQTLPTGEGESVDSDLQNVADLQSSPSLERVEGSYPLELNTMPGFAGSSAYYLRYMDPKNDKALVSPEANEYWRNVDLYIGGTEHATGHLIYSRFWNKFLFDLGIVCEDEPFKKLINQVMIQGRSNFVYRIKIKEIKTNHLESYVKRFIESQDYHLLTDIYKYKIEKLIGIKNAFINKNRRKIIVCRERNSKKIIEDLKYYEMEGYECLFLTRNDLLNFQEKIHNFTFNARTTPKKNIENKFIKDIYCSLLFEKYFPTTKIHVDVNIVSNDVLDTEKFRNWNPEYKTAEFILEDGKYHCGWAVEKMSKSMYNVVNPDDIVEKYGADTLRLYEMFLGPLEQSKPWDTNGIDGVYRFLKKLWTLFYKENTFIVNDETPTAEELKVLHKTIKKITFDIENFSYNTSVSAFMICVNELFTLKCSKKAILEPLTILLLPFAPHIAEELYHALGNEATVCDAQFPVCNEFYLVESSVKYPISFNGKVRFMLELPADMSKEDVQKTALANEQTIKQLDGNTPKKIIVVQGKIVNIVM